MAAESLLLLPDADPSSASLENVTVDGARVGWRLKRRASTPFVNHALGATVIAPTGGALSPTLITDGALYSWYSNTTAPAFNVDLDLGSAKTFDCVELTTNGQVIGLPNSVPKDYEIYVSTDGVSWGSAIASGQFVATDGVIQTVSIASQTKRHFRLRVLTNWGDATFVSVGEIRLSVAATKTNIASDGTFTTIGPTLVGAATLKDVLTDGKAGISQYAYGLQYGWTIDFEFAAIRNVDGFEAWTYPSAAYSPGRVLLFVRNSTSAQWELIYDVLHTYSDYIHIVEADLGAIHSFRYWRLSYFGAGAGGTTSPTPIVNELRIWEASQTSYDTGGPSSEWTHDFGQVCELGSVATREDVEGAATIRYQYGLNGGGSPSLNGSWLTETQLATALNGNSGRYLRLAVQFNSNGSDRATFRGLALVASDFQSDAPFVEVPVNGVGGSAAPVYSIGGVAVVIQG